MGIPEINNASVGLSPASATKEIRKALQKICFILMMWDFRVLMLKIVEGDVADCRIKASKDIPKTINLGVFYGKGIMGVVKIYRISKYILGSKHLELVLGHNLLLTDGQGATSG